MRRITVLLVPLLVLLLQAAAFAGMHNGATAPQAAAGAVMVIIVIFILASLIKQFLGAGFSCALFVAVASVATMILVGEYALMFAFGVMFAQGAAQLTFLAIVSLIVLVVVLIWGAHCCLNKAVSLMDALKITIIPALLPVLYSSLVIKRW